MMEPTRPLVCELDLTLLRDEEFRELWSEPKLRFAIARQVYLLRLKRGLTQDKLALKAGICFATVNRIENGWGGPVTLASLRAIARAFDVRLSVSFIDWGSWLKWIDELESGAWIPPVPFAEDPVLSYAAIERKEKKS